ncbi:suppressor of rasval19 [Conoideocrella luteorostrata]|uniref:Suppressor of rasval19 n=1 Tax=Conoideocrella luteorostrata TaxID=1105319 RepID=A0AAJ0FXY6_9HYPO|nr:suppressor of rasval19 [Conoideocrella luteorostrata]
MANQVGMHNVSTLLRRLEAVVSRLEDLAATFDVSGIDPTSKSTAPATKSQSDPSPYEDDLPPWLNAFDSFVESSVQPYVNLSSLLGGLVSQQANAVLRGFQEQRKFLLITTKATKPDAPTLAELLEPTKNAILAAVDTQASNRFNESFTHLTAVADGIRMLAWVNVQSRPFVYVEDAFGSAQFFGNKLLKAQADG